MRHLRSAGTGDLFSIRQRLHDLCVNVFIAFLDISLVSICFYHMQEQNRMKKLYMYIHTHAAAGLVVCACFSKHPMCCFISKLNLPISATRYVLKSKVLCYTFVVSMQDCCWTCFWTELWSPDCRHLASDLFLTCQTMRFVWSCVINLESSLAVYMQSLLQECLLAMPSFTRRSL